MKPYLSIVMGIGGVLSQDLIERLQNSTNNTIALAEKHGLSMELVIVEWNLPAQHPGVAPNIRWPRTSIPIRIINVPSAVHTMMPNPHKFKYFEWYPKNIGIRRAAGDFILSTNPDDLYSEELIAYFATQQLRAGSFYRVDRHDMRNGQVFQILRSNGAFPASVPEETARAAGSRKFSTSWAGEWSPDRIHYNASGDFTLMSKQDWFKIHGNPEREYNASIDGQTLYLAHLKGIEQIVLPYPTFHPDHVRTLNASNDGWWPSWNDNNPFTKENGENWGLRDMKFNETVIMNGEPMAKQQANTALVLIAAGENYWKYIRPIIASAHRFFVPHEVLLFTDSKEDFGVKTVEIPNLGFPKATLMRYHLMLSQKEWLSQFARVFYSDVDMLFVDTVDEEIFSEGITAVAHPGWAGNNPVPPDLERNPNSTAYLDSVKTYFCGGFNGGASAAFLAMAEIIKANVDTDQEKGIIAKWHDESHLNKYLQFNPPAKVLSPSYCYPETNIDYYKRMWGRDYTPRVIALTKGISDCDSPWRCSKDTLIAIVTCEQNKSRVQAQRETWIPAAIRAGYDVQIFDGKRLGVSDDYYSLHLKTKAICKWAADRGYKRLMKTDDDTYIRMDRFWTVDNDYAGIVLSPNDYGSQKEPKVGAKPRGTYPHQYCSGGCYWLSQRAFGVIADAPFNGDWAEDRWVGNTLATSGILPHGLLPRYTWTLHSNGSAGSFADTRIMHDTVVVTQLTNPDEIRACHVSNRWDSVEQPRPVAAAVLRNRPQGNQTTLVVRTGDLAAFKQFDENVQHFEPHTARFLIREKGTIPDAISGWSVVESRGTYCDDINAIIETAGQDDLMICTTSVRFLAKGTSEWLKSVSEKNARIGLLSPKVQGGRGVQGHPLLQPHLVSNPWSVVISGESLEPLCLYIRRLNLNRIGRITDEDLSRQIKATGLTLAVTPHKLIARA